MPITFTKSLRTKMGDEFDSQFVTSSIQINVDAAKTNSYPTYGTNWADISGNGYNYTLIDGGYFDGNNDGSIYFVNGAYADSPNFGSTFFGDFTYEVWIKPENNTGTILREIDKAGWQVSLMELVNGVLRIGAWVGGVGYQGIGTLDMGKWYQLVMTYSNSTHTMSGYINGELTDTSSNFMKEHPANDYYLTLADNEPISNFGAGYASYTGRMSSLKLYNRVLTDEEVLQNYNSLRYRYEPLTLTNFESNVTFTINS